MSPTDIAVLTGAVSTIVSWIGAGFIAGYRWGNVKTRLDTLEKSQENLATKDQLAGVKEDVAEIKGMFRMTLKEGH